MISLQPLAASNAQDGLTGEPLPLPLLVRLLRDGAPVSGVAVSWETDDGSVGPATTLTDGNGIAATSWTLGTTPGAMSATARVPDATLPPVRFSATARAHLTLALEPGADGQVGPVGEPLPRPVRIRVLADGKPRPNTQLSWQVDRGGITPGSGLTDGEGYAEATWTLGTISGEAHGTVTIRETQNQERHLAFSAVAVPGPPDAITVLRAPRATLPVNPGLTDTIRVLPVDRFGNPVTEGEAHWSISGGALSLLGSPSMANGIAEAVVHPSGSAGFATVRVATTDPAISRTFPVEVRYEITLDLIFAEMQSGQNGSSPAVDTLPVGSTMYLSVVPQGIEGLQVSAWLGPEQLWVFSFADRVSWTYPVAGTFEYSALGTGAGGTVVVQ